MRIFLSKPQAWHIISPCGAGYHHGNAVYLITRQRAFSCGLMIYNAPHWWYTATSCGWYARLRRDLVREFKSIRKLTKTSFLSPTHKTKSLDFPRFSRYFKAFFIFVSFHFTPFDTVWGRFLRGKCGVVNFLGSLYAALFPAILLTKRAKTVFQGHFWK